MSYPSLVEKTKAEHPKLGLLYPKIKYLSIVDSISIRIPVFACPSDLGKARDTRKSVKL